MMNKIFLKVKNSRTLSGFVGMPVAFATGLGSLTTHDFLRDVVSQIVAIVPVVAYALVGAER